MQFVERPGRAEDLAMQVMTVKIEKPDAINFDLGQTHFIKSVEDIHEAMVPAVPMMSQTQWKVALGDPD
jgi:adenosine/AMP kinase